MASSEFELVAVMRVDAGLLQVILREASAPLLAVVADERFGCENPVRIAIRDPLMGEQNQRLLAPGDPVAGFRQSELRLDDHGGVQFAIRHFPVQLGRGAGIDMERDGRVIYREFATEWAAGCR